LPILRFPAGHVPRFYSGGLLLQREVRLRRPDERQSAKLGNLGSPPIFPSLMPAATLRCSNMRAAICKPAARWRQIGRSRRLLPEAHAYPFGTQGPSGEKAGKPAGKTTWRQIFHLQSGHVPPKQAKAANDAHTPRLHAQQIGHHGLQIGIARRAQTPKLRRISESLHPGVSCAARRVGQDRGMIRREQGEYPPAAGMEFLAGSPDDGLKRWSTFRHNVHSLRSFVGTETN